MTDSWLGSGFPPARLWSFVAPFEFLESRETHGMRQGSIARPRYGDGYIVIAEPPEDSTVGKSQRAAYQDPRRARLSEAQIRAILRRPDDSLRELAAEFGVSHETVRSVRQRAPSGGRR